MTREGIRQVMSKYVPVEAVEPCVDLLLRYRISMRITEKRASKLGDYRPPMAGHLHRITINHDLNAYAFTITFLHEVAHLITYNEHKNNVEPHGVQWKQNFKLLLLPFLHSTIFPDDVKHALVRYMSNPAASTCRDVLLYETLLRYDGPSEYVLLKDVEEGTCFVPEGLSAVLKKGKLLRKNYVCAHVHSAATYRVSPLAKVKLTNIPNSGEVADKPFATKVMHVSIGGEFLMTGDRRRYVKMENMRTYARCKCVEDGHMYRIHMQAEVEAQL